MNQKSSLREVPQFVSWVLTGNTDSGNPGTNGLSEPDWKLPSSEGLDGGLDRDRTYDPRPIIEPAPILNSLEIQLVTDNDSDVMLAHACAWTQTVRDR